MTVIGKADNVPVQNRTAQLPEDVPFNFRIVNSSHVDRIGWPVSGEPFMLVIYQDGGEYGYLGVSRQQAVAAANAPSVGKYIAQKIKGHYKPVRLS